MIRVLRCKDPETGEEFNLKAIKHDSISKFEILLPEEYRVIYGGMEWCYETENGEDIHIDVINNKDFRHLITVVNLKPKTLNKHYLDRFNDNEAEEFENFKKIVSGCAMACICLNDDNILTEILYCYQYNEFGVTDQEDTLLFGLEKPNDDYHFYARENY